MYLLDTNICIYAMKNKFPSLSKKLLQIPPKEIFISSITTGELEYGAAKSKWGEKTRQILNLFLSPFTVIPFDEKDSKIFGKIRAILNQQGMPIGPYDLQIAAQAISRGLTIITHNTDEFGRVPNIKIEDWVILA